jgi:hypothetical protein
MRQECVPAVKPTIEEIQEHFIEWRNTRRCRGPVPEQLWEAAVMLAEDYSIGYICKVLGLNNRQLKRKIQASRGDANPPGGKECHFVELAVNKPESGAVGKPELGAVSGPELGAVSKAELGAVSGPESDTEYIMEMEDQKGGKLKVHLKGGGASGHLLEMAKAFWGRDK